VDRLERLLALYGDEGSEYTLTFGSDQLPVSFKDVRKAWRSFKRRLQLWNPAWSSDYVYLIEGRHGDHRYHIHLVLRDSDFSPTEVRHLWRFGEDVDDEPLLRGPFDTYRRTAKYFNKEATDGVVVPIGSRTWVASQSLRRKLPPLEQFRSDKGTIQIPEGVRVSGTSTVSNSFGEYHYAWWIKK
jgi:hypothetical protein